MYIKMQQEKNVQGRRVTVGEVLEVGPAIPNWQADIFCRTGIATEFEPKKKQSGKRKEKSKK